MTPGGLSVRDAPGSSLCNAAAAAAAAADAAAAAAQRKIAGDELADGWFGDR